MTGPWPSPPWDAPPLGRPAADCGLNGHRKARRCVWPAATNGLALGWDSLQPEAPPERRRVAGQAPALSPQQLLDSQGQLQPVGKQRKQPLPTAHPESRTQWMRVCISCWISRRYKRALTGTANGGRHKAMPCLAEEVLKAPVGQPAFQQLKGAAALYCQSPSLSRSLAARHIGAPLSQSRAGAARVAAAVMRARCLAKRSASLCT